MWMVSWGTLNIVFAAYQSGHAPKNPADYWYQGELTFFDEVILPLANRIRESGFFGDDVEEFVTSATSNRQEWKLKGKDMIAEYQAELKNNGGKTLSN